MKRRSGLGDVSREQRNEGTFPGIVGSNKNNVYKKSRSKVGNNIIQNNRFYQITPTSVRILPHNVNRKYLLIVNTGAAPIYISFGSASGVESSIPVVAGGNYEPWVISSSEVHIRTDTGVGSTAVVSESYEMVT